MGKRFTTHGASIRYASDVVKVIIFSDNKIVFRGTAPVSDKVKVGRLLADMEAKGVIFPK